MNVWVYIAVALSVGLLAGPLIPLLRNRTRKWRAGSKKTVLPFSGASSSSDLDAINFGPRRLSYEELRVATRDFSNEKLLGRGGFGSVYKGIVVEGAEDQSMVAIKRMAKNSKQGEREFLAEVLSMGRLRHRNLVSLLGWCHDGDELLLVYEFMAKGSLDQHLCHKLAYPSLPSPLSWQTRFQILQGIASALEYLHGGWEKCILHCDIKPSNVLLDAEMTPKLGDFGLAHLRGHTSCSRMTSTPVGGTLGYMAPEVYLYGQLTKKADVYSFGMVALEVVCGRRPQGFHSEENEDENLVEWVWSAYKKGQLLEVIDPFLKLDCQHQVMTVLQLGMLCTLLHPPLRPCTNRLVQALRGDWTISLPPSRWHTDACMLPKPVNHYSDYLGAHRYSYAELVEATNGFSSLTLFKKGSYALCYKGLIKGETVVIKKFTPNSRGEEFHVNLLTLIGKSRHRNLITLLGWCDEQEELLLVYEYMDNGFLDTHLYSPTLTWSSRLEILRGVAAAVDYIHNGCQEKPAVLHRDIKPRNVILDKHMNAKLTDFGVNHLVDGERESSPYIAPELVSEDWDAASVKSDVYSFGVMALEMVFRRPPETILKTGLRADMIDAFFKENDTDDEVMKQQITRVLQLGMLCCLPEANLRPHSNQLLHALYGDWNLLPQQLQVLQECPLR